MREADYLAFPIDDLTPVVNFVAPGSKPSLSAVAADLHETYIQQWNLYAERMLGQNLVVRAGYVGTKSTGLEIDRYPNTPLPGAGDVQSRRPFSNLSSVRLFTSDGFSKKIDADNPSVSSRRATRSAMTFPLPRPAIGLANITTSAIPSL